MDRSVDVRTPESIAFSYDLAGLGSRFLAVTVDMVIQVAIMFAVLYAVTLAAARVATDFRPQNDPALERLGENVAIAFLVFLVFAIFFGYFIVFEALWNGQTPGKRMLGIRVVRDGGYPVDFMAVLIRNLIRVVELGLGGYAVSAVSALVSPENKRIGDIAAGTIVVRDGKSITAQRLVSEISEEPAYAATAYMTGEERALVKRFIERRDDLPPDRRRALASGLAARVRPRVAADLQRLDDEALLERL
ncbi:MAG: RDD family protein [Vulcanimicrobiaceae bacterium]